MGLFSNIWGKTKIDPYGAFNPEQQQLTKSLGPYLQSQLGSGSTYSGQYVAPFSAAEQGNLDNFTRLNALRSNTLEDLLNVDPQKYNEDFTNQVERPTTDFFRRNVLPYMEEQYPGFSTARQTASGRAWADIADQLSTQRWQGLNDVRNRALTASGALNEAATTGAQMYSIPRLIQQAGLDKQYQEFVRGSEERASSIDRMLNFLGVSTGTAQYQPGLLDRVNSLAGTAANIQALFTGSGNNKSSDSSELDKLIQQLMHTDTSSGVPMSIQ